MGEALTGLFLTVLGQGFREVDKELRNNVLVTLALLLSDNGSSSADGSGGSDASGGAGGAPAFAAACHDAGLTSALLAVACAPELTSGAPHVKPWALTTEELDLELKLLAWGAVTSAAAALPDALDAVRGGVFVPLLLQYLDCSGAPGPALLRWNADRLSNLRSAALAALHRLAPLVPDAYTAASGMAVLVALLTSCPVPMHVEAALRHLHALATRQPGLADALGASGVLAAALDLAVGATAAWPDSLRAAALQLLAALCAPAAAAAGVGAEANRRRLRKADGVTALLGQAAALAKLDPTLPSPLALAVLDAVWCCVVPDRKNAAQFLVNEGMDLLLDHLQRGNRAHRPLLLSLLADLLENPRAHPFFHEWRSDKDKQCAAQLLIGLWKEEDSKRGMTISGVLANPSSPLQGLDKRMAWVPGEEVAYGNMAPERRAQLQALTGACDGEQLLAKVYAVFRIVGFASLTYVSLEEQAVLYFIEKYVKFKQGEVWRQIKAEFEAEGMRPTAPDRERLASGIELAQHLAEAVKEAQQQVLDRHLGTVKQQERKFFADMQSQKKYEQEMRFFGLEKDKGQLSIAELRANKQKKEQMLKSSIDVSSFGLESLQADELATAAS